MSRSMSSVVIMIMMSTIASVVDSYSMTSWSPRSRSVEVSVGQSIELWCNVDRDE